MNHRLVLVLFPQESPKIEEEEEDESFSGSPLGLSVSIRGSLLNGYGL